jgi:protein SMG5
LKCNAEVETMYRLHLSSAYGFYNHLILRFQSEFNSFLQLDGFLDFPLLSIEKQPNIKETSQENRELLKEVATRILHKFLICLGDLARYQIEYDPNGCTKLAYKYYQMSMILMPSNGMPLNQLGTLYGSENYGCDAAYYYLYCLCCSDPFLSASENLRLLFAKNRKLLYWNRYMDRFNIKSVQFSNKNNPLAIKVLEV